MFRLAMSNASLFMTTATSCKLLLTKVEPELTISKIPSANPIPGAISTEPVMTWMSASTPFSFMNFFRILG